jgi:hypothetical protein
MLSRMSSSRQRYRFLVEALRLIAARASVQRESVEEDSLVTDEITAAFGMAYPCVELLAAEGILNREALRALEPIHTWIWLDVDSDAFFPESLSRHPYWANGRRLAARALSVMGEKVLPPDPRAFLHISVDLDELEEP